MHSTKLVLACGLVAFGGCALGPDHIPRIAELDTYFVEAPDDRSEPADEVIAAFWRGFKDAQLTALVEQALAANIDVKLAQARLQETRAAAGVALANRLPTVGVGVGAARDDPAGAEGSAPEYTANASFNWELDFFGRTRRAHESAAALVQAGEAGVHAAQRLISAEVASNYLALRGLQERLRVAQEALLIQREVLRLVEIRNQLGRGTPLDVARARALVDTTDATIPALEASISRTLYRLATLSGQTPHRVNTMLAKAQPLPSLAATDLSRLSAGAPESLLRRRPDIKVAERQLAAATANIGVAKADLFPRVNLTGLLGFTSKRRADLFERGSRDSNYGASLSWTLLDFGGIRSRVDASEAQAQQALLVYEQTVQLALEETESALAQYTRNGEQSAKLESAARNSEEAARIARIRFEAGADDFLTVLDAERTALLAHDTLVQAQVGSLTSLVDVYRALGGGWSAP